MVGGLKLYGASRRDVLRCYGELIGLLSFIVDPDVLKRVLKRGAQAVLEPGPDLTRWDVVSFITCIWYSH